MKITIVYDNTTLNEELKADWGFSCFIEFQDINILFDTGAKSSILLSNMEKLNIDPLNAEIIFISHQHGDHLGGLYDVLKQNKKAKIYLPFDDKESNNKNRTYKLTKPTKITENIISSGLLECDERKGLVEQSLFFKSEKGLIIIAGCSHPGVRKILERSRIFGKPFALIGGFHGFNEFELLEDLELVCPTHCTKHINEIKHLFPTKYIKGGVGKIIHI